jgi:chemotaxis protein methyltransferase CheR
MTHTLDENLYLQIHDFVNTRMGLYFSDNRKKDLIRGLNHASETFGYKDINTCVEQLLSVNWTTAQIQTLANYLTIGETYFYRHKEQLDYIFNSFIKNKTDKKLKIWSAGCCSGEEPYSLAIMCHEYFLTKNNWKIEIIATDLNPVFLKKAVSGIYTEHSLRVIPKHLINKYFEKIGRNQYKLDDSIRNMVKFNYLNLAANTYPSEVNETQNIDVLFCRNVFIYFTQITITKVVSNYRKCLNNNGIFFVSPAETFMVPHDIMNKSKISPPTVFFKGVTLAQKQIHYKPQSFNISKVSKLKPVKEKAEKDDLFNFEIKPKIELKTKTKPDIKKISRLFKNSNYEEIIENVGNLDYSELRKNDLKKLYTILCRSYANIGKPSEASEFALKLIETDKIDPDSYFLHASILLELDKISESIENLRSILFLKPNYAMAHFMLGNIYRIKGEMKNSIRHFKNAYNLLEKEDPEKIHEQSDGLTVLRLMEIISTLLKAQGIDL